ncbi:MAG TPA: Ig-like domain-containing protein [Pirellulales bacterium]|nr:Ig-like domain-containing protein [Pirellulales bacterium]
MLFGTFKGARANASGRAGARRRRAAGGANRRTLARGTLFEVLEERRLLSTTTFPQALPNDPLFREQWNLQNTGQTGGTKGADINVVPAWQQGYTGQGVVVGVVDSGVYHVHPDLAANYRPDLSYNFFNAQPDPTPPLGPLLEPFAPGATAGEDSHGTEVAGIIAASANNGIGVAGIAPNAQFGAERIITFDPNGDLVQGGDTQLSQALTFHDQQIDVYNNSWGYVPQFPQLSGVLGPNDPLTLAAMQQAETVGRSGLGNIFVFAGGNAGNQNGLENTNDEAETASRYAVVVSALGDDGKLALYSASGANTLVAAPGGHDGAGASDERGIPSTSVLAVPDPANPGQLKYEALYDDNGTWGMNGTSAATPDVTGVIALMLQANPKLTWRDVQEILAESATKNDPTDTGIPPTPVSPGPLAFPEPVLSGWFNNGYGYTSDGAIVPVDANGKPVGVTLPSNVTVTPFHLNDKYGFGEVNAGNAVTLAKTWTPMQPEQTVSSGLITVNQAIPDGVAQGVSVPITFTGNLHVEHAEVVLNITHPVRGDIEVILTSPNGTRSVLQQSRSFHIAGGDTTFDATFDAKGNLIPNADYVDWGTSTVQDWGQSATGTWTVSVSDRDANGQVGTFDSFTLNLYGTQDYAPIAQDFAASTALNQQTNINVLAHTYDTDGTVQTNSVAIQSKPIHGSVSVDPQTGQVVYTPNVNFAGVDTFTYTVLDDQGVSSRVATVTVNVGAVNQAPVANDDGAVTLPGNPVDINVLANDTVAGATLVPSSVTIVTQPSFGTATVNQTTGVVTYTPGPNYTTTDSFTYTVQASNGLTSNVATVTISRTTLAPVANDDVVSPFDKNTSQPIDVLANDSDAGSGIDPSTVAIVQPPQFGTAQVNPVTGLIIYTPAPNFFGNDSFTYTVKDHQGLISNPAHVSLTVLSAGSPLALDHEFVLVPGFNTITGIRTLDNPTNRGSLTATLVTPPALGTLVLNPDGTFTYSQGANFHGLDSFTYQVSDGQSLSNVATIRLVSQQFHYVERLYHDVLGRTGADADIMYWINTFPQGGRAQLATIFLNSNEYRTDVLNSTYQQMLGRPIDAGGLAFWLQQMQAGLPIESVITAIAGSGEYIFAHGNSTQSLVQALYQNLLGRAASAGDVAYWSSVLNNGVPASSVAAAIVGSTEFRSDLINGYYQSYLGHPADLGGLNYWLSNLQVGLPRTVVQAGILSSDEYFRAV